MEELRTLMTKYENLTIGTSVTLETLKHRIQFQETNSTYIAMSTLNTNNYHAPEDLEGYTNQCCKMGISKIVEGDSPQP